jgi:RNA polymerase sigma-70 factor (ECF subfamily)
MESNTQQGNGFDFEGEFGAVAPALAAWATLRLRGPLARELTVDDLLQEVACRAFARREQYDPEQGNVRAWVFGIARNVLLRALEDVASGGRLRQADWLSTQGFHRVPDNATSVARRVLMDENLGLFVARLETLSEADRRLVVARGLEGLSHADVAAMLGIDEAAASKRWDRLRLKLQSSWGALDLQDL